MFKEATLNTKIMSHHKIETSTKNKLLIEEKYIQTCLQNRKTKLSITLIGDIWFVDLFL